MVAAGRGIRPLRGGIGGGWTAHGGAIFIDAVAVRAPKIDNVGSRSVGRNGAQDSIKRFRPFIPILLSSRVRSACAAKRISKQRSCHL